MEEAVKALIEYLARELVDDPDSVRVTESRDGDTVTYQVRVGPNDLGKVIGRQGRIANALRLVAKAAAARSRDKVYVDIET